MRCTWIFLLPLTSNLCFIICFTFNQFQFNVIITRFRTWRNFSTTLRTFSLAMLFALFIEQDGTVAAGTEQTSWSLSHCFIISMSSILSKSKPSDQHYLSSCQSDEPSGLDSIAGNNVWTNLYATYRFHCYLLSLQLTAMHCVNWIHWREEGVAEQSHRELTISLRYYDDCDFFEDLIDLLLHVWYMLLFHT